MHKNITSVSTIIINRENTHYGQKVYCSTISEQSQHYN